jgi:hypothetical protein
MVWLHSLQGMAEHAATFHVDLAVFCYDGALDVGPGPEVVVHGAPWGLGVGAVVAGAVFPAHEARRRSDKLDVDKAVVVHCGLDRVRGAIFGELNGDAVGEEGVLLLVEAVVAQRIAGPQHGLLIIGVEDLAVELDGDAEPPRRSQSRCLLRRGCRLRYVVV